MMKYELTTPPTEYPVTVDQIRRHLVLDTFDDDLMLEIYLQQAIAYCEARTGLHIGAQKWTVYSDGWCGVTYLPFKPVTDVQIQYYDTEGTLKYLDNALYVVDLHSYPVKVTYTDPGALPELQDVPNNVMAEVSTGYTTLPKTVEAAIQLITGHLYERREDSSHVQIYAIPMGANAFLDTVRVDFL